MLSYLFHLLESVLRNANIERRIVIYTLLVVLLSIPREFLTNILNAIQPPFTDHRTFVNHYLIKNAFYISYGSIVIYHIVLSSVLKSYMVEKEDDSVSLLPTNRTKLSRFTFKIPNGLIRVVLLIVIYFLQRALYGVLIEYLGSCTSDEYKRAKACNNAGYKWRGVSFSGHIFRQLLSNLIILEECAALKSLSICSYCDMKEPKDQSYQSSDESSPDSKSVKMLLLQISVVILAFWVILLDVELIPTLFWFHEFEQKVMSLVWALGVWGFSYNFVFPLLGLLDA